MAEAAAPKKKKKKPGTCKCSKRQRGGKRGGTLNCERRQVQAADSVLRRARCRSRRSQPMQFQRAAQTLY